jgi:hypothetical protein
MLFRQNRVDLFAVENPHPSARQSRRQRRDRRSEANEWPKKAKTANRKMALETV